MSTGDARRRAGVLTLCWALALAGTCGATGASVASAGEWMEVSCVNPDQSRAPSEGWTSFSAGVGFGSTNGVGCAPGSPMFGKLSTQAAVGVGANETLQYSPPSGSTLVGGSADVSLFADGGGTNASGTAIVYTPSFVYDGSNVVLQCAWGLGPCQKKGHDFDGVVSLPGNRGGSLFVSAACGGAAGYVCNVGGSEGAWALVRVWWANLLLSNDSSPGATAMGGTLLSPNASGIADVTFAASDPGGPGVYSVSAEIDGKIMFSGTPDTNGGKCLPVGSSGGALMFDYGQPCRVNESVDLAIDTSSLEDGTHTLKLRVEDAAQNTSVVYDGTISTRNHGESSLLGATPASGGSDTVPLAASQVTPTALGSAISNGSPASEHAQITLGVRGAISRSYTRRALKLAGRLLNSAGQPIGGALLQVLQRIAGSELSALGSVKTSPEGTFVVEVPAGPSRVIEVAYRAYSSDVDYAARSSVEESVGAGVKLRVTPRRTGRTGQIRLVGSVGGPIPRQGVIVHLLVRYRGRWEPFRTPRTDASGRFNVAYQFQGAVGHFPFRAEVPGGQASFPFAKRSSGVADVATR